MSVARPKLKICGINDAAFAAAAVERGVDYLGFIFVQSSPRGVTSETAAAIRRTLGGAVKAVGVFVRQTAEEILAIAETVGLDVIQLHRCADDDEVRRIRELARMKSELSQLKIWVLDDGKRADAGAADGLLLDGRDGARTGGTGKLSDWSRARELAARGVFTILAGGISAANIADAAATGVSVLDVNSSLEDRPGHKIILALDACILAARCVRLCAK